MFVHFVIWRGRKFVIATNGTEARPIKSVLHNELAVRLFNDGVRDFDGKFTYRSSVFNPDCPIGCVEF